MENEVTEVGSDWGGLQLAGLRPRHCVIANTEGIVTVTPSSRDADIYVNGQRIYDTTMLQNGTILRFGRTHYFRFAQRGRPFAERWVRTLTDCLPLIVLKTEVLNLVVQT